MSLRVIAGQAKGHRLKAPTTGTRPMTDRMKEALFSALGEVESAKVLDLYAGSGSLGLEALSRGAKKATFVENARDAIVKLESNIDTCGLKRKSDVVWSDVSHFLNRPASGRMDLIFVDPPYNVTPASVQGDLEALVMNGFLADEGRIVVHRPEKESALKPLGLQLMWDRAYGQSQLYIFGHEEE
ncbi:MAG: 16S rRNA (guanine(966)-N(2))-methyltransferase RsmD [Actinobacteria bacterium]|nr:16S rRNA (guanine(966)-N(2))-methyltransferase RsmD [Actinomycetota bacterium]